MASVVVLSLGSALTGFSPHGLAPLPSAPVHAAPLIGTAPVPLAYVPATPSATRAASGIVMQEEDDETLEAVKIASGFFGVSIVAYSAMTQLAGLDEVLAGNLVLVGLCIYGAYLLFFDGGVTQAALESQAILQLAVEEAEICAQAPQLALEGVAAQAVAAEPSGPSAALSEQGVLRVNGAVSEAVAAKALAYVNDELTKARTAAQDNLAEESRRFGDVLARTKRFDLKLDLDPPVQEALAEALVPLTPLVAAKLGEDAELFELSALISDPGAPRQPIHPDTPSKDENGAVILTTFIALQDTRKDMGPTGFCIGTNTPEAHVEFNDPADGGRAKANLLRTRQYAEGVMSSGDMCVMDSQLVHGGGANDSDMRRVMLYVSYRKRGARTAPGSLLYELKNKYTLADADEMLSAAA